MTSTLAGQVPAVLAPTFAPSADVIADRALVDRIVYMGTLASQREVIDPLLDSLRLVTSRWDSNQSMAPVDREQLRSLEASLKDYLLHRDPIRTFTAEELDARLQKRAGRSGRSNPYARQFWLWLFVSLLVAGGVFLAAAGSSLPLKSRVLLPAPFFFLVLQLGSIWFFLSAFKNFNPAFRRAFTFICFGVLSMTLLYAQLSAVSLFKLDRYAVFQYAGITALVSLQFAWMYGGFRIYARLLGLKTRLLSLRLMGLFCLLAALVAIAAPRRQPVATLYFDISLAFFLILAVILWFDAGLTRLIARHVTPAYAKSIRWLFWYFAASFPAAIGVSVLLAAVGSMKGDVLNFVTLALGIGPQLLLFYTGYSFKKETSK